VNKHKQEEHAILFVTNYLKDNSVDTERLVTMLLAKDRISTLELTTEADHDWLKSLLMHTKLPKLREVRISGTFRCDCDCMRSILSTNSQLQFTLNSTQTHPHTNKRWLELCAMFPCEVNVDQQRW
jgi:hypothetical protein